MKTIAEIQQAAGGCVVSDPAILGGKPVFRGTRLPVETLFACLADGLSPDYYLETFPPGHARAGGGGAALRPAPD